MNRIKQTIPKYLSTTLNFYFIILFLLLIIKLMGFDYFGINTSYQLKILDNDFIFYLTCIIPLTFNQYFLMSLTLKDNSKKLKTYNFKLIPFLFLFQYFKLELFGVLSPLFEIIYLFIIICIYLKKIDFKLLLRLFYLTIVIIVYQFISTTLRYNLSIDYIDDHLINMILNLDYILMLLITLKLYFSKGDVLWVGHFSYSQTLINLKNFPIKLQKSLSDKLTYFKNLDKETKLTFIIFIPMMLIYNLFTLIVIFYVAMLNDTIIECLFILISFISTKTVFGKAFHFKSANLCFVVSNIVYYSLNRITTPIGISILVPIILGIGMSYITSMLVKELDNKLYKGMDSINFDDTILKVVKNKSIEYNICKDYYVNRYSELKISVKYNYGLDNIQKIKQKVKRKLKELK